MFTKFRRPFGLSIASYAVTVFNLKQGDSWPPVIASGVEVFGHPPMNRTAVKKGGNKQLVAKQFMQILLLFDICHALGFKQEVHQYVLDYLIWGLNWLIDLQILKLIF
jgi:hypothetical protein